MESVWDKLWPPVPRRLLQPTAPTTRLRRAVPGAVVSSLLILAVLALAPSAGQGRSLSQIRAQIARTRSQLEAKRGHARVLSTDIARITTQIHTLQAGIGQLEHRQALIQADLDVKRGRLLSTQADLRTARGRLARLRLRLAHSQQVLARRLVALYESDRPDIVGVVLSARGFADLLETSHYVAQVGAQDKRIIEAVRSAKHETTSLVKRLGGLEARQRSLALAVLARRDEVARVKQGLAVRRNVFASARGARAAVLARVNTQASTIKTRLDGLEGDQAAIERRIQAASATATASAASVPAGPIRGGGTFIWPINGVITSPFCERRSYEACHPGMDIAAPTGTPIRAAAAGRVILASYTGGYGNYTCIQHSASLSSCYGHQSSIAVSVGQSVSQGQVIGAVGSTGHSTGPHLHFEARVNGGVVNPLNYL